MSFSSPTVKGRDIESCLLMGNPHKSTSEVPGRWQAFVRPFRCTLVSWACRSRFLCSLPDSPHWHASPFYTVHILSYHITVTRLSASHQVGEPSFSPIYVVTTANRHFFLSVSGRSVWAAKLWPRIPALQVRGAGVSLENLHTLTR